jgi:hypothetical protein
MAVRVFRFAVVSKFLEHKKRLLFNIPLVSQSKIAKSSAHKQKVTAGYGIDLIFRPSINFHS